MSSVPAPHIHHAPRQQRGRHRTRGRPRLGIGSPAPGRIRIQSSRIDNILATPLMTLAGDLPVVPKSVVWRDYFPQAECAASFTSVVRARCVMIPARTHPAVSRATQETYSPWVRPFSQGQETCSDGTATKLSKQERTVESPRQQLADRERRRGSARMGGMLRSAFAILLGSMPLAAAATTGGPPVYGTPEDAERARVDANRRVAE